MKSWQNNLNEIFNLNAFFFFLLTCDTWYYHSIYLVFTYFESFTDHEDDIFEVISNFHIQGSKFGGKITKFGRNSFKKLHSTEFMEFVFSKSSENRLFESKIFVNSILKPCCMQSTGLPHLFFFYCTSFGRKLNKSNLWWKSLL